MKKSVLLIVLIFAVFISLIGLKLSMDVYFNVNKHLTSYASNGEINFTIESAGEEPAPTPSPTPTAAGGGGGGGVVIGVPDFKVSPESINAQIVTGKADIREIEVENTGRRAIAIDVSVTGLADFIVMDSNKIILNPREKKKLTITLMAGEPGVYAGKIIFVYQGIKREVLVLLNVISDGVLFDVSITIPEDYRVIKEGEKLPTLIELIELGDETGIDVTLNYLIKDFDDNLIYSESETLFVKGKKSFSKEFDTSNLIAGDYIAGVELTYPGGFGSASAHFEVVSLKINYMIILAILILILAIIIVIYSWRYYKKKGKNKANMKRLKR